MLWSICWRHVSIYHRGSFASVETSRECMSNAFAIGSLCLWSTMQVSCWVYFLCIDVGVDACVHLYVHLYIYSCTPRHLVHIYLCIYIRVRVWCDLVAKAHWCCWTYALTCACRRRSRWWWWWWVVTWRLRWWWVVDGDVYGSDWMDWLMAIHLQRHPPPSPSLHARPYTPPSPHTPPSSSPSPWPSRTLLKASVDW